MQPLSHVPRTRIIPRFTRRSKESSSVMAFRHGHMVDQMQNHPSERRSASHVSCTRPGARKGALCTAGAAGAPPRAGRRRAQPSSPRHAQQVAWLSAGTMDSHTTRLAAPGGGHPCHGVAVSCDKGGTHFGAPIGTSLRPSDDSRGDAVTVPNLVTTVTTGDAVSAVTTGDGFDARVKRLCDVNCVTSVTFLRGVPSGRDFAQGDRPACPRSRAPEADPSALQIVPVLV